jgi:hypothetical protein
MNNNPTTREIYDIIMADINKNGHSTLTNPQISALMNYYSQNQVRDKIVRLVKEGYLQRVTDTWHDRKYYARILYKGTKPY